MPVCLDLRERQRLTIFGVRECVLRRAFVGVRAREAQRREGGGKAAERTEGSPCLRLYVEGRNRVYMYVVW